MKLNQKTFLLAASFAAVMLHPVESQGRLEQNWTEWTNAHQSNLDCASKMRTFDPLKHKMKYRVAVHAIHGFDEAYLEYNQTFSEYLTVTAGQRFDPPIGFEMVPVNIQGLFDSVQEESIDFIYSNPGIYSCIGVEFGAQPLVTVNSRFEARGHMYDLDVYGGVMIVRADNDNINEVKDFRGKVIGAGGIDMMMAGQLQFHEMAKAGLSYVMDPLQVVFTYDQEKVVNGVLNGQFDVGFVRTEQVEDTHDEYGNYVDPELFKVIAPKIHILDDGNLFPFLHSTEIYPEMPVAALTTVPRDVAEEVQHALMAFRSHVDAYEEVQAGKPWDPKRCDTTPELAELAEKAALAGHIHGFRNPRSYFGVRSMHEEAGFLTQNDRGEWHCTRADTLYEGITCPEGHYKLPIEHYEQSCEDQGLVCQEGFDCFCKPCIEAFEVDVYQWTQEKEDKMAYGEKHTGCSKMSLCGTVEQTKTIKFRLADNRERNGAKVEAIMHLAKSTMAVPVTQIEEHIYELSWTDTRIGVAILEIFVDGVMIPESPIRVQVEPRNCEIDHPGERKENTEGGDCICESGTVDLLDKCVTSTVLAIVISIFAVLLVSMIGLLYLRYKRAKNDALWMIEIDELQFDDPVEVVGQGSFGVVLCAQYRGTKVAIKRALKNTSRSRRSKKSGFASGSKGSKTSSGKQTRSIGISSTGMGSIDSDSKTPPSDPEAVDAESANTSSHASTSTPKAFTHSTVGRSGSNSQSLGFLARDYGHNKWSWLPWGRRGDYHSRFKEAILGVTGSASAGSKTWHAILCPWFNAGVQAEEEFMAEMRTLSRLRHPCITTVMGAVVSKNHDPMLVMEFMEYGSLYNLLSNETMHLTGEIILQISRDIAQGLRFLHSSKPPILHGDLKGRNILVDARFRAKLCDFGLSTKTKSLITGTPYWLAPEYLRGQTKYTEQCDIYSVGMIFYEIYARKDPYAGEDFRDTLRKVCDRRVNKRPAIPDCCPTKMVDLMKKCWNADPMARPLASSLDAILLDMNFSDAEPSAGSEQHAPAERRTGDMMYDLFPRHIADALKAGQKVEPEQHDEVTVVFSDIIHFTDISRVTSPLKVSNMLDRLYLAFDRVARKHQVFKVETIGDAYMGVTNLEKKQMDNHVKNAALFAIDLVQEANQILIDDEAPEKGYINIRVGFHSGPVVSNVIGSLNPRYGLFGDTVNTSSRMESNSKANRILCSEAAYKLLIEQAPDISVKKRGRIAVKGKGDMTTYWVGDAEIQQGKLVQNFGVQQQEEEQAPSTRHVDFCDEPLSPVAPVSSEEEEQHHDKHPVDDHLWRRDLKQGLTRLDSGNSSADENAGQETKKPPRIRKNVKEAVHFTRGSNMA